MTSQASSQTSGHEAPPFEAYGGSGPENYERYFVPAIGAPLAGDLVAAADLRPGDRVLDVACGTGIIARLAADRVGVPVTGLDSNRGMLAVARSATPPDTPIDWCEADAQAMPFAEEAFDIVLCQMGLQFFHDKPAALAEMRRVLAPQGRLLVNLPGPTPDLFSALAAALQRHIGPPAAQFVHHVFSLHDTQQLHDLISAAGFQDVTASRTTKTLELPPAAAFLWQYVHSTPLAAAVAQSTPEHRAALERDLVAEWRQFADARGLRLNLGVLTADARKTRAASPPVRDGLPSPP